MKLAAWNIRPCTLIFGSNGTEGLEVVYRAPGECKALLDAGEVDVALIGVNEVLVDVDAYTILPQAVLASASTFPYATLRFKDGVAGIRSVEVLPTHQQAGDVAEVILREEYGLEAPVITKSVLSTNGSSSDAYVAFDDPTDELDVDNRWLDIGQEWFELTGLPLVWGVYAVRTGTSADSLGDKLEAAVSGSMLDSNLSTWIDAHPTLTLLEQSALESDLRLQFDADVLAGLDELVHYLFYYGKVDDIPTPRFSKPPQSLRPSE